MKKTFTLLLATFLAAAVNAQQTTVTAAGVPTLKTGAPEVIPPVVVDENLLILKETEFDFGKIPQGKPVTHVFEVTNKSKDSLKILNVQASCGCTTPDWEKDKAIATGGNTKINVGYNAAAEGPFTKYITIFYNGTQTKQIVIKGEVWKTPAVSAPENKSLNDIKN